MNATYKPISIIAFQAAAKNDEAPHVGNMHLEDGYYAEFVGGSLTDIIEVEERKVYSFGATEEAKLTPDSVFRLR